MQNRKKGKRKKRRLCRKSFAPTSRVYLHWRGVRVGFFAYIFLPLHKQNAPLLICWRVERFKVAKSGKCPCIRFRTLAAKLKSLGRELFLVLNHREKRHVQQSRKQVPGPRSLLKSATGHDVSSPIFAPKEWQQRKTGT